MASVPKNTDKFLYGRVILNASFVAKVLIINLLSWIAHLSQVTFFSIFRYRIKGIKNIIFYELPLYSTFYSEILNHMDTWHSHSDSQVNPVTCTVLYTKSNALRLAGVVGANRCAHMISSDQQVHMFVTGDDES